MGDPKIKAERKDASRLVKDAAASLKKAADEAGRIAKSTTEGIRGSKEVHEAQAQAGEAVKAIEAAAKAATVAIAAGVAGLSKNEDVRRVASKTVDVAKAAGKVAGDTVKKTATTAGRKAAEVKDKVTDKN
ncbi:MAG: hypothetical protein ACRDJU_05355 [Actinomycetota bacterium]